MNNAEYLKAVYGVITKNFRSNDPSGSMTAASAASIVRTVVGHDQTFYGFEKFKDVLQELENQGLLKTGPNSKHAYAIWLPNPIPAEPPKDVPRLSVPFQRLRKPVWFAFVAHMPLGGRYLHRQTGEVRIGTSEPLPIDQGWVRIDPVSPNFERGMARDFLRDHGIEKTEIVESIESDQWYVQFPKALSSEYPALASEWKRVRSHQIINIVKDWSKKNNISEQVVYEPLDEVANVLAVVRHKNGDQTLRQLLLTAIERMSTEDLLRVEVPARQLVAVLRPELLS
ncbi:MAG: hypothetical protein WD648_12785 [Planctomycetaceae bacterium]